MAAQGRVFNIINVNELKKTRMRLRADFEMRTDWLVKDYRSIFMALIKSAFMNYDPMSFS